MNLALYIAINGAAVGWLVNDDLLVNFYNDAPTSFLFDHASIYSADGVLKQKTNLPDIRSFRHLSNNRILDLDHFKIYDLLTGQLLWSSVAVLPPNWKSSTENLKKASVAGNYLVYAIDSTVYAEAF